MFKSLNRAISTPIAIIIVIIVGVLAIGGVLVYQYYWQAPKEEIPEEIPKDETVDWKTYRNEEYGFEVKYPKAYSQKVEDDKTGLLIVYFENTEGISYYSIYITEKIRTPKLSNFLSNPECYDQIETKKQNNIDWNINRWKCGIGSGQNPIAAYAVKQNYVFEIQLDSNSETSSLERINQILSTFKFIGAEESEKPSITVLSPNGGEKWTAGKTYTISWTANNVKNVIISLLQGSSRAYLISPRAGVSSSLQKFDWKIDDAVFYAGRSDLRIVLSDAAYCGYVDEDTGVSCVKDELRHGDRSDNYFSIIVSIVEGAETADWEIYRNKEYGFEIKYPNSTKIGDIDINGGREVWMQLPFPFGETKLSIKALHIRMVTTQINMGGVEQPATCTDTLDTQQVIINGMDFNKNDISSQFGGTQNPAVAIEYCTMKGNKAFKLVFELSHNRYSQLPNFDKEKESEVFDQMLSTFKFID